MIQSIENYAPDGELLSFFRYSYDREGNLISMEETEGTWTYGYDKTAQLTSATAPDGTTTVYTYDLSGNRTSKVTSQGVTSYEANELNQYTSFGSTQREYDLNGNLISQTDENGTTKYEYDYQDRLIRTLEPDGTSTEYTYDVFGNRSSIRVDGVLTEFINTPTGYGQVLTAIRNGFVESDYIQGNGLVGRICYDQETDSLHFFDYSFNHLGSTSEITDESGNVVNRYRYDQEGNVISSTEEMENPFTYIGRYGITDDGNGLYYVRARYLSQDTLSFISPDPSGQSGGLNLYCYAYNNPVMYADINGELGFWAVAALVITVGLSIYSGYQLAEHFLADERDTNRQLHVPLGAGYYFRYGLFFAAGASLGFVFKGVGGKIASKFATTTANSVKGADKVVSDKAIKAAVENVDDIDDYAKALAAESEIASISKQVATTGYLSETAAPQVGDTFIKSSHYFTTIGILTTGTGVLVAGSNNPALGAPVTVDNIDLPVKYVLLGTDTSQPVATNCYLSNGVLKWGVTENVYILQVASKQSSTQLMQRDMRPS